MAWLAVMAWLSGEAGASEPAPDPVDPGDAPPSEEALEVLVEVPDRDPGERILERVEIEAFPMRSPEELMRALPGLHLSSHGGRGKAWQFFYRGFDAEHGADLAVSVEGVPLNEPSNVHAHGYTDAALLPAMLIRQVRLTPGADRVDVGNFGTAAAVDFGLGLEQEGFALRLTGGSDRSGALTAAWRPEGSRPGTFVVLEGDVGAGVTDVRGWRQLRAAAGLEGRLGGASARLAALAYRGDFRSPGSLRAEDVETGRVGFYDGYPTSGGGLSERLMLLGRLRWDQPGWAARADAWVSGRNLRLDQNFTGFLQEGTQGDGTRQTHGAVMAGARGEGERRWQVAGHTWRLRGGVSADVDVSSQQEDRLDTDGRAWATTLRGSLRQVGLTGWAEAELGWRDRLSVIPGVRLAGWHQDVASTATPSASDWRGRWIGTVAPRVRVEARPLDLLTLFAGYGRGYRAPRASGGVLGALVMADTVQGGAVLTPVPQLAVHLTAFWTRLDDEQVFEHTSGRFVGAGATRRLGGELVVRSRPVGPLRLDAAFTFADGRFTATGDPVPFAPRLMGSLGVSAQRVRLPLGALTLGLRAWVLGPRPLPRGFQSVPGVSADLLATWEVGPWAVGLQLDNAFFNRWRDGEFVYASWWDQERPRSELPVLHLTAGDPSAVRLWLQHRW